MAALDGSRGEHAGLARRQRELLGLLLASSSASILLPALATARAVSSFGPNEAFLATGGWTSGGGRFLEVFVQSQTPLQAVLLAGALVLVGQGAWHQVGTAAKVARALIVVLGAVVGVAAGYGAVLYAFPPAETGFTNGSTTDARVAAALVSVALAATALVSARLAFGLLPLGGSAAGPSDAVGDAEEAGAAHGPHAAGQADDGHDPGQAAEEEPG